MKSFSFRLDQALRWRAAQVDIAKAKAAAAAALLSGIQSRMDARRFELTTASADMTRGGNGAALQSWPAWKDRCERDIAQLEHASKAAEQEVATAMKQLVVANQNAQVLEKLRSTQRAQWNALAARELEAFAGETFLRQVTIGKRTGA